MTKLRIIKIGGNVIDNPAILEKFLNDFCGLDGFKILIHGGGKIATKIAEDMGIRSQLIEGRRITDAESLKVVTMVYAGLINKSIVAGLQGKGCNAIGLTGADGNMIRATKRPLKKIINDGKDSGEVRDYGFAGDLDENSVNARAIQKLLEAGFIPVFSAITHDGNAQLLNTNADTIASAVAIAMSGLYPTSLVYCLEKSGVLRDVNDEASVISTIDANYYKELKDQGVVSDGMIPKLDNAFDAIKMGLKEVCIGNAEALPLLKEQRFGTRLIIR